jgi:hypothetical protein
VAHEIGPSGERVAGYATLDHVCVDLFGSRLRETEAAVREFMWTHWRARERAVATLTRHSKEGEPSTSILYIEPAATGEWRVRVVIERLGFGRGGRLPPSGQVFHTRTTYTAISLHRIEVRHDGLSAAVPIDDGPARDPGSYLLSLRIDGVSEPQDF